MRSLPTVILYAISIVSANVASRVRTYGELCAPIILSASCWMSAPKK